MKKIMIVLTAAVCCTGCAQQSVGVIGGADGPTAILVSSAPNLKLIVGTLAAVLLIIGVVLYLRKRK